VIALNALQRAIAFLLIKAIAFFTNLIAAYAPPKSSAPVAYISDKTMPQDSATYPHGSPEKRSSRSHKSVLKITAESCEFSRYKYCKPAQLLDGQFAPNTLDLSGFTEQNPKSFAPLFPG